jgi:hypothetical protein
MQIKILIITLITIIIAKPIIIIPHTTKIIMLM